jgi:transcriptional regulator with XRE-family HTH domain
MEKKIDEGAIRLLVSKNLKRLRNMQNLSQMNLAIRADLTHNFINDIENGKKGVSNRSLAKLAAALKVEPYQLFLPDSVADDRISGFVYDVNSSLQQAVDKVMSIYLPGKEPGKGKK